MSLIMVQDLSFTYEGSCEPVFSHISFRMDTGWKVGLIGRNGRGKTTFLKLLQGLGPYSGVISAPGVEFAYFPYRTECGGSALETVLAQCPGRQEWEALRELSLLEIGEETARRPFSTLSAGEQTKALLAAMFLREDRYLLIDEPTNHLDLPARQAVGEYLRRKRGFLLVSHDRALLDRCVDHIVSINRSAVEVQAGTFSSWQRNALLREQFERGEQERLRKEIGRLSEAAERTSRWADAVERTKYGTRNAGLRVDRGYLGHKSAKMMARSKAIASRRREALEEAAKLLKDTEEQEALKLSPLRFPADRLMEFRDVSVFCGGRAVVQEFCMTVRQGERIALTGRNGCGKSSLLKLAAGQDIAHSGTLIRSGRLLVSYVPQHTEDLAGTLDGYLQACGVDGDLCRAVLRKLGIPRAQFEKNLEQYSEGQKKKVLIARSLCQRAHLYLRDEPMNYFDVISRMQMEALLLEYRPTMLFAEHDRTFCETVATRIAALQG